MTQGNCINVKKSTSPINKFKSAIKNATQVTLKLSSNIIGDSYDQTNFQHKLLLTNIQFSKLLKTFANNSSANMKS